MLSIDLPGMTEQGQIRVDRPSNSTTQSAINQALEWWNENRYEEGYVNAAQTSFKLTTSYSQEQTALDIGFGAGWASGTADALLSQTTNEERRSLTAVYKQAFYTVTMDTPPAPESVFDASVSLSDVQQAIDAGAPPAYVATVTYGKIIMARMETTLQTSRRAAEAAFRYAMSADAYVEGSLDAEEVKALAESSIEIVVLGGNAATASEVIAGTPAAVVDGIQRVIRGENAVYSRSNPGVPIAYTVRHLRDNSLAKLGYTTEYTATECTISRAFATVTVHLDRFFVQKDCDGIEGPGDFSFQAEISSSEGRQAFWEKTNLVLNDSESAVINQEYRFELPVAVGAYFRVHARGEERDQPVIGSSYLDTRMAGDTADRRYAYQSDGTWSNYARGRVVQLDIGTSASECRAQLWYTVRDIG
jgi:thiol-activated cytolysin